MRSIIVDSFIFGLVCCSRKHRRSVKRGSNTSAFLWSLRNFLEWRTSANDCFWRCSKLLLKTLNIQGTKVASDKCSVKKVLMMVDVFWYWLTSLVMEKYLTKWAALSLRIIWGIFFWWKTILTQLRILNCRVLYLRFTEAITLNCSRFVWKGLGLRDRTFFQNTNLWHNITIPPFWKGNLSIY